MNFHGVAKSPILLSMAFLLACTGCEMNARTSATGSAGIADSAASAASAAPNPTAGSAPGAK
jgi:hypothetical protein